ncbi:PREDICTED: tRNA-splicing endonuclease [Prunus dulcis]|uniref:PREDICTED: tRNA-splicing endonuclease n=2 Tax=Prunus dulcis TaxID=3755 RepID=A0A5E4FTY8_PRUDU|nr:PREDICTED: tRNA-splicing endonuclease [Prunus dulcis]
MASKSHRPTAASQQHQSLPGIMEVVDWGNSLGESVSEARAQHANSTDEENHYASGFASKFQPRKITSKAHWNDQMGMAEVVVERGRYRISTGIVRHSKLYYSIEEVLFLVEIGDLLLLDDSGTLSLEDIYMKISDRKNGCCWEEFQAYRQLKSLGYIVGRHGIPWSMKSLKSNCETVSSQGCPESDEVVDLGSEETRSVIGLLNGMQINEARLIFDVYLPNSKFRKSSPGDPSFVLCFTRGPPPSKADLEALERQCQNIPLKVCHEEQGWVSFFSFDKVELPVLP